MNLPELQAFLYQLITTPERAKRIGNECDSAFGAAQVLVRSDQRLSAIERINIYADAYFHRLLDCLHEDFPGTSAVVGSDNFVALVRDYLSAWPPTEPSIFYAGRYLPAFLRNHPLVRRWPFISELARLERAILDVFHAADVSTLSNEAMRAIPPQQWSTIRLKTHPAVEILHNEWRVTDLLGDVQSGREWEKPAHRKSTVIVWRQHAQVYHRDLEEVEAGALAILSDGASFAVICEEIALSAETDHIALIGRLLARWLDDGTIIRADIHDFPDCPPSLKLWC